MDPQNPQGEKLWSWHPRVTDCLYRIIHRFPSLYSVCYFDTPDGPGGPARYKLDVCRQVEASEAEKKKDQAVLDSFERNMSIPVPVDEYAGEEIEEEAEKSALRRTRLLEKKPISAAHLVTVAQVWNA